MRGPFVDVTAGARGPFFPCSDFDVFLVPIVRDGCLSSLGAFCDYLSDRGNPFGEFLRVVYHNDAATGHVSRTTIDHVVKRWGYANAA